MRGDYDIWPPYTPAEQWRVDYHGEDEGERDDETDTEEGGGDEDDR